MALSAEDELISKFKVAIGEQLPAMFRGIYLEMLEKKREIILNWLKDNKDLVKEVIES
jgi:hypothetical protein